MAGYSGTPLIKKLGIKPGHRVGLLGPPAGYVDGLGLSGSAAVATRAADLDGLGPFDAIQGFFLGRAALVDALPRLRAEMTSSGTLWLSWPKKASGVATDLGDAVVREAGLALGLVDVKVCAVDETWSALKFVVPLKDRPKGGKAR